jgi:O-antigen/teichoic acid export membrane protein
MHKKWVQQFLEPAQTLKERAIQGSIWLFIQRASSLLLWLLRVIVLARLLTPEDFGLFGIAFLAMSALETLSQTGFGAALIQKKEEIESYLDTAWTIQLIRGAVLALILLITAPYLARFFNEPTVTPLLRLLALSPLLRGLTNIGILYFQKELEFDKQFLLEFSGPLLDLLVTIAHAYWYRNVWALLFGTLAGHGVQLVVSYLIHPYRPRLRLEKEKVGELYQFGRWLLGSAIIYTIGDKGINALVGKMLGATGLGFYQMAERISNMPTREVVHIIRQVSFPVYSKIQDDMPTLRRAYLQTLGMASLLIFPLVGATVFFVPDLIRIFLGSQWIPMTAAAQVLALWGITRCINALTVALLQAVGRPDVGTKLTFVWLLLLAIIAYPLTVQWGLLGASFSIILSLIPVTIIMLFLVSKIIRCRIWHVYQKMMTPTFGTIIMLVVIITLKKWASIEIGLPQLFLLNGVGLLTYLLAIYLLKFLFHDDIFARKELAS